MVEVHDRNLVARARQELPGALRCVALWPLAVADNLISNVASRLDDERHYDGTPVLLVHGYGAHKSGWVVMRRRLIAAGAGHVRSWGYNPHHRRISDLAGELAVEVHRLLDESGARSCHIVGHSLGGVLARYAVSRKGISDLVDTVVTLGSPHLGAPIAGRASLAYRLGVPNAGCELNPASRAISRLNAVTPPSPVRFVAVYSDADGVVPTWSARIDDPRLDATNVLVGDVSHCAMTMDPRCIDAVIEAFDLAVHA